MGTIDSDQIDDIMNGKKPRPPKPSSSTKPDDDSADGSSGKVTQSWPRFS